MKLAFFDDFKVGVVAGDSVVNVTDVVKDISRLGPQDVMRGVIERFDPLEGKLGPMTTVAVLHRKVRIVAARRTGEPFGTLVLAVAVTIIEVAPGSASSRASSPSSPARFCAT
jgi:hypothetical protein